MHQTAASMPSSLSSNNDKSSGGGTAKENGGRADGKALSQSAIQERARVTESTSALFERWTEGREVPFLGTNSGADPLAFQAWHRFKEAFSPELIFRSINEHGGEVKRCLDQFGGSGTTALSAQFLGIPSTTVEINPFLADVIQAKVATYNVDLLARDLGLVTKVAREPGNIEAYFGNVPKTFLEPGVGERWLFDTAVATQLASLLAAIDQLENPLHQRLFRVLVGGLLAEVSNVVVSGKGRRYRKNWQQTRRSASQVMRLFTLRARAAISDVHRFARPFAEAKIMVGDARRVQPKGQFDVAVFSPPYPNSFDYTDVYNLELWMLGYLSASSDNQTLRRSTLSSHVQLQRKFAPAPDESRSLTNTLDLLEDVRPDLWSPWIPEMVGAYFADLLMVLERTHKALSRGGKAWIVVGDSSYAGIAVPTAKVLKELTDGAGWSGVTIEKLRQLSSSAQQRKVANLFESLVILTRES